MLVEIIGRERACLAPLFQAPPVQLVYQAVLAGNARAQLWVDDAAAPTCACLWDEKHRFTLVGRADRPDFTAAVAARLDAHPGFLVVAADDAWQDILPGLLPRKLPAYPRRFYTGRHSVLPAWRAQVPEGYQVLPITRALLADPDLANTALVIDEITSMWPTLETFLDRAFGTCVVHAGAVVCWCTGEYFSSGRCGIGIETLEGHQRRGLATLAAAACVEEAAARGFTPHWDSWRNNTPSCRVAEKVGFTLVTEYTVRAG